jgi:hypothetical protein
MCPNLNGARKDRVVGKEDRKAESRFSDSDSESDAMRRHEQQMVAIDSTKIETAVSRQPVTLAVLSAATRFFPNPIPSQKIRHSR